MESAKANQTDKHDRTVLLYANNDKEQHSYKESAKSYGYQVLLMNNVIDNHFMQHMEHKGDKLTFVRVDSDTADKLVQKDEEKVSVSEKQEEKVKTLFTDSIGDLKGGQIELRPLSPEDNPVLITRPEFMRRMMEMQRLSGMGAMGDMPESHNVVINTNHPLVADKLLGKIATDKKERFAKYLYNLARLNQNMLKGEEMSEFIKTSIEFLK